MEVKAKERMDVIMEHISIAHKNSDTVTLKITDGYYVNFGRSYYHIDFEFLNKDGSECYKIITNNNSRISWYIHHESYYMIKNEDILEEINNNIRKDYEWVMTMVQYHTYHKGSVTFNWYPTLIDSKDTMIKQDPPEKNITFTRKDDILEESGDITKMIEVEKRCLSRLEDERLGIAKEYMNIKNGYNVGDIVYMDTINGLEFAIIDSVDVYKNSHEDNKGQNDIEKGYWLSIHKIMVLKGGKAKKIDFGGYNIKGTICKEKEFTKISFENNVKGILNKDNLTKLYHKLKTNKEYVTS